jgi:hypothetical protein
MRIVGFVFKKLITVNDLLCIRLHVTLALKTCINPCNNTYVSFNNFQIFVPVVLTAAHFRVVLILAATRFSWIEPFTRPALEQGHCPYHVRA